jgi:hypothetical protein
VKLMLASVEARRVLHRRNPGLGLPGPLPVTGLVLAPSAFYGGQNAKPTSVAHELLERLRAETEADVHLATWAAAEREIRLLA